jgi:uncharacterized protein
VQEIKAEHTDKRKDEKAARARPEESVVKADAAAKVVNATTNLAAILAFAITVPIWVGLGMTMAIFNVVGSLAGSRAAIKHGSGFVRKLFLFVVTALILKTAYDAFLK